MTSRRFTLAGLLRLRHLEEDVAEAELAKRNSHLRDNEALQKRVRRTIDGHQNVAASADQLRGLAAGRAAASSQLNDLLGLERIQTAALEEAQAAYTRTRINSRGIEKLEQKHTSEVITKDLLDEQNALDEIATSRKKPESIA